MQKTAEQIIADLKKQYENDDEALAEIARRENDIKYVREAEKQGVYNGQPAVGIAQSLESFLAEWY